MDCRIYLYFAIISSVLIAYGSGYIINTPKSEQKSNPGMCYDEDLQQYYRNGTINQRKGFCEIAKCMPDLSIQIRGCSEPSGPTFCTVIPTNYGFPFPKCCAKVKCM